MEAAKKTEAALQQEVAELQTRLEAAAKVTVLGAATAKALPPPEVQPSAPTQV